MRMIATRRLYQISQSSGYLVEAFLLDDKTYCMKMYKQHLLIEFWISLPFLYPVAGQGPGLRTCLLLFIQSPVEKFLVLPLKPRQCYLLDQIGFNVAINGRFAGPLGGPLRIYHLLISGFEAFLTGN